MEIRQFIPYSQAKSGKAPGTLTFVGTKRVEQPSISLLHFGPDIFESLDGIPVNTVREYALKGGVKWFNITGVHDDTLMQQIGEIFKIHPLHLEDVMNTSQRPQFHEETGYFLCILRMLEIEDENGGPVFTDEQVSIITGKGFLISFQEAPGDTFDSVRDRITRQTTRIRQRGADYLGFALMDTIVDEYVLIAETLGEKVASIENEMLFGVKQEHFELIRQYKSKINFLSTKTRPARELVVQLIRSESPILNKKTYPYLKDLLDHSINAVESLELNRDRLRDLQDFYDMTLNNKLNDAIRLLTIFSVIFIPLTFLAGIYGMNFEYMPELDDKNAYPILLGTMALITVLMIIFFKKRKWL